MLNVHQLKMDYKSTQQKCFGICKEKKHASLQEYLFVYFNPIFQRILGRTGRNIYYKISSLLSPDTSSVKSGHFSCSLSQCGKVAKCISPSPNTWFPGVSEILLSTILVTIAILDFHKTLYLPIPTLAHVIQLSFSFLRVEIHVLDMEFNYHVFSPWELKFMCKLWDRGCTYEFLANICANFFVG